MLIDNLANSIFSRYTNDTDNVDAVFKDDGLFYNLMYERISINGFQLIEDKADEYNGGGFIIFKLDNEVYSIQYFHSSYDGLSFIRDSLKLVKVKTKIVEYYE